MIHPGIWTIVFLFLSACAGNKIVLTYPDPSPRILQPAPERKIGVLVFGDVRKNSAVGLKREGRESREWIKIKTDTSIVDLVTGGVKKEMINAGYRVVAEDESNILVTGEIMKFEAHYIIDDTPFVLAMAQLRVLAVDFDQEKDSIKLIYQEEFLAGAQEKEFLAYSTELFADALQAALQRVCRKIASSQDLVTALRDYSQD